MTLTIYPIISAFHLATMQLLDDSKVLEQAGATRQTPSTFNHSAVFVMIILPSWWLTLISLPHSKLAPFSHFPQKRTSGNTTEAMGKPTTSKKPWNLLRISYTSRASFDASLVCLFSTVSRSIPLNLCPAKDLSVGVPQFAWDRCVEFDVWNTKTHIRPGSFAPHVSARSDRCVWWRGCWKFHPLRWTASKTGTPHPKLRWWNASWHWRGRAM